MSSSPSSVVAILGEDLKLCPRAHGQPSLCPVAAPVRTVPEYKVVGGFDGCDHAPRMVEIDGAAG